MFFFMHELTRLLDALSIAKTEVEERKKQIETIRKQGFGIDTATHTVAVTMLADAEIIYHDLADQLVAFYERHKEPKRKAGILNDLEQR